MPEIDASDIVEQPLTPSETLEETVVVPAQEDESDVVIQSVEREEPADSVLKAVLYGLAEEQSSLRDLRKKKSKSACRGKVRHNG